MPVLFDTPFGFSIDVSFFQVFLDFGYLEIAKAVFILLVWYLLVFKLTMKALAIWQKHKQAEYVKTWQWVVLAIDVPAQFVQSPKAVEQIFSHLSGAQVNYTIWERIFAGMIPKWFSFELISVEGYIQFIVRTEMEYRDLVEASIYAQYNEAEITEIEDFVVDIPDKYPNDEYDAKGLEFSLAADQVYPIRTYEEFEYTISKDVVFSDPMAAILENFSRIGVGEYLWMHLAILPIDNSWKKLGIEVVKNVISGKKPAPKASPIAMIGSLPVSFAKNLVKAYNNDFAPPDKKKEVKKDSPDGKLSDLTPGGKAVIESIEEKIAKIGFKSRLRAVYVAKKEVFQPSKCLQGLSGAMNQFYINNRNGFKVKNLKAEEAIKAYKGRVMKLHDDPYILNIEELATVWHFPLPQVKTPLLQKADIKRSEPPINLPVENFEAPLRRKPVGPAKVEEVPPPPEIMYG